MPAQTYIYFAQTFSVGPVTRIEFRQIGHPSDPGFLYAELDGTTYRVQAALDQYLELARTRAKIQYLRGLGIRRPRKGQK